MNSQPSPPLSRSSLRRRRVVALCSLAVAVALFAWLTVFVCRRFAAFGSDPAAFKAFVNSYDWKSRLVALGIQVLQVVVSFIPGEAVEIGIGYAFGPVEGTLLCLGGVGAASALMFTLVKRFGVRVLDLFIDRAKIDNLRFINSEQRLKRLIFLLFFIPGTPKDLLTYFAGLTRIRLHEFLVISLIARIPSVVSSTVGGNLIQQQNYLSALWLFLITGAVSLAGILVYHRLCDKKRRRNNGDS